MFAAVPRQFSSCASPMPIPADPSQMMLDLHLVKLVGVSAGDLRDAEGEELALFHSRRDSPISASYPCPLHPDVSPISRCSLHIS